MGKKFAAINYWKYPLRTLTRLAAIIFYSLAVFFIFTGCQTTPVAHVTETLPEDKSQKAEILVAYATRAGSTIEVAQAIGEKLAAVGAAVDVKPVKNIDNLDGYRAVVLGSAIRRGAVLPETAKFVKKHKEELNKMPVAYFIVCMITREDTEKNRARAFSYLEPLVAQVPPRDTGIFTGKLDYSTLNFIELLIIKYFIGTPEGDLRDWKIINDWAERLSRKLRVF
ncbi:MAG TPA: flavodoxin [Deltaproteobacteria bacterium]|nr:flavodoxin [Deltaproteobacteria bacterium]